MKKQIITILLALVALEGQGQTIKASYEDGATDTLQRGINIVNGHKILMR